MCLLNENHSSIQIVSQSTIKIKTGMTNAQKNILYGGPEPPNFTEGTQSLGELCLKRFSERANTVVLVKLAQ